MAARRRVVRTVKHLTLTLLVLTLISSIAYYTLTHPNRDEVGRLRGELGQLEQRNADLARENHALERSVLALRDDPRLAERRARSSSGLAKPDELIFKFERPGAPTPVQVVLDVTPRALTLAGRTVALDALEVELVKLREQLPNASLEVRYAPVLGAVARQRIQDMVEQSPIERISYVSPQQ